MLNLSELNIVEPKTTEDNNSARVGGITLVYHKNSKRIIFSKRIINLLGNPEKVTFKFAGNYLILKGEEFEGFSLKSMSKQKVIYNANLIKEILDNFNIKFEDAFIKTFSNIEEIENVENTIAIKIN